MILVDTSVWIDHFRHDDPALARSLDQRQVLSHPFVIGELALGILRQSGLDGVDAPRRHRCAIVEVLNTT